MQSLNPRWEIDQSSNFILLPAFHPHISIDLKRFPVSYNSMRHSFESPENIFWYLSRMPLYFFPFRPPSFHPSVRSIPLMQNPAHQLLFTRPHFMCPFISSTTLKALFVFFLVPFERLLLLTSPLKIFCLPHLSLLISFHVTKSTEPFILRMNVGLGDEIIFLGCISRHFDGWILLRYEWDLLIKIWRLTDQ